MNSLLFFKITSFLFCVLPLSSISFLFNFSPLNYGSLSEKDKLDEVSVSVNHQEMQFIDSRKLSNSIILVGDILLARNVEFLTRKNGSDYPFSGLNFNTIATNPIVVGNFEASIPEKHTPTENMHLNFSVDSNLISSIKKAGFTHLSLANNHSFDFYDEGLNNARTVFDQNDLVTFGDPNCLCKESVSFLRLADTEIAIIGMHNIEQNYSDREIEAIFEYAKVRSDFQIVYIHWGIEYEGQSSDNQQQTAKLLVENGADLIVGHHPHVVQEIAMVDDVLVFYSLGNYIFDQYFDYSVQVGLLLELNLDDSPVVNLLPIESVTKPSVPALLRSDDHKLFLNELAEISDYRLTEYIQNGIIPIKLSFATSTKIAMMGL